MRALTPVNFICVAFNILIIQVLQILGWDERRGEYDSATHGMRTRPFLLIESLHPVLALCQKLHCIMPHEYIDANKHNFISMCRSVPLKDQYILICRLSMVKDFLHFQREGLTWPQLTICFCKPAFLKDIHVCTRTYRDKRKYILASCINFLAQLKISGNYLNKWIAYEPRACRGCVLR